MHEDLWHSLLAWYDEHKRDLPWRHTRDPYAILVAETMLQQTGVERVIPKYRLFLESLPTLESLAGASPSSVIRLWSGLGYNRRAVWMQEAARQALLRWGGLPQAVPDLLSLPGIGPYTARAVACFAFDAQVAVCDTNVRRVLTRLLLDPDQRATRQPGAKMLALAAMVLPPGRAYRWNQALMDLGATVCAAHEPFCLLCPLASRCRSFPLQRERRGARAIAEDRPRWKTEPFQTSRRYYRGRIVEALRHVREGESVSLAQLGYLVKKDYTNSDAPWLLELVRDLQSEGLVSVSLADDQDPVSALVSLPG